MALREAAGPLCGSWSLILCKACLSGELNYMSHAGAVETCSHDSFWPGQSCSPAKDSLTKYLPRIRSGPGQAESVVKNSPECPTQLDEEREDHTSKPKA